MDESSTWDYRNQTVTVRAKDTKICEKEDRIATYRLVPSDRASRGELKEKQQEIAELEQEIKQHEQLHGIKDERIDSFVEQLQNRDHDSEQEFERAMTLVLNLLNAIQEQNYGDMSLGSGDGATAAIGAVQDSGEALTNGSTEESE